MDIYCRVYLNMCTAVWHILTKIQYMEETLGKTSILHFHKVLKVDTVYPILKIYGMYF